MNDVTLLLSSSKDGYILIHKLTANFTTVQLHKRCVLSDMRHKYRPSSSLSCFRFKIVKERNPVENARPRSAGGTRERAAEAGLCITSFDFSPKHPSIFIVGTLCGGIYKCSLDSVTPIEGCICSDFHLKHPIHKYINKIYIFFFPGDATLIDPVIDEYERHGGSITCIKCAPLRDLFVSSATDKEIRIYSLDEVILLSCFISLLYIAI